jgi:Circularly permutated YpsA SLOG family
MDKVKKILSGGQTGVDQAALRAAQACDLDCGGWCPPGRLSESGKIPSIFPLMETPEERSAEAPDIPRSQRTEWNVRDSDATLILQPSGFDKQDPGTEWAKSCAERFGRSLLICDPSEQMAPGKIKQWLRVESVQTLNVAGPSEKTVPGIGNQAYLLLQRIFSEINC